jgi:hypothetical protein
MLVHLGITNIDPVNAVYGAEMTAKITVFYAANPGATKPVATKPVASKPAAAKPSIGTSTDFEGASVEYRMEHGGALRIMHWMKDNQTGDTLFAPGQWSHVSRSAQSISSVSDVSAEAIKDRVARFIGR